MSASRNLGLREAAGEYVAYLDGDGVWLPTKLEQQLAILEERAEVDAVYGPLRRWRRWADSGAEDDVYGFGLDSHHPYADSVVEPPTLVALFLDDEFYIPGGLLIRREAALNVGGFEEEFGGMYEDAVFLVKLLLQSSAFVSSQSSYLYRMHDASCNHVAWLRGEERAAELHYLEWVESYLTSTGTNAPELRRSLRRASFRVRHPVLDGLRTPGQVLRVALTRGRSVAGRARSALAHASNPRRAT